MQILETSPWNHSEICDTNNPQLFSSLPRINSEKELRQKLIDAGKIWQVYTNSQPDTILCEGFKTKCFDYIRLHFGLRAYKKGTIRLAQVIYEP